MKRFTAIILALLFCFSLTACNDVKTDSTEEIEKLKKEIKRLESKLDAYETGDVEPDNKETEYKEEILTNEEGFTILSLKSDVTLDFAVINVNNFICVEEILPTDTSGVYSYIADENGEQYWCLEGTLKNTHTETYDVENIVAELCFDNKYTYSARLKADDGGNDFYGSNVKPLDSVKFYIYSSVPDEMIDTYTSCTVKFGFKESFSGSYYDDFEECDYLYTITINK